MNNSVSEPQPADFPLMLADTMASGTGGKLFHAHDHDARGGVSAALCGQKPGKRGYWGYTFGNEVTCPRCKKIIQNKKGNQES